MAANGALRVVAIDPNPSGSAATRSPWLIHTGSLSPGPAHALEQRRAAPIRSARSHIRARSPRCTCPPSRLHHALLAVANPEHRHARRENRRRNLRRVLFKHAGRAARQDDCLGLQLRHRLFRRAVRDDLGIDVGFAHAPRDQLGELTAEIDDQDQIRDGKTGQGALLLGYAESNGAGGAAGAQHRRILRGVKRGRYPQ